MIMNTNDKLEILEILLSFSGHLQTHSLRSNDTTYRAEVERLRLLFVQATKSIVRVSDLSIAAERRATAKAAEPRATAKAAEPRATAKAAEPRVRINVGFFDKLSTAFEPGAPLHEVGKPAMVTQLNTFNRAWRKLIAALNLRWGNVRCVEAEALLSRLNVTRYSDGKRVFFVRNEF